MQAKFLTGLECKLIHSGWWRNTWELTQRLMYYSEIAGEVIVVPVGFQTDFASVPRVPIIWWLYGGIMQRPAVVHDWIYHTARYPRRKGDSIFRESIEVDGGNAFLQHTMYTAVRACGWGAYNG